MAFTTSARAVSVTRFPNCPAKPTKAGRDSTNAMMSELAMTVTPNPKTTFSNVASPVPANTLERKISAQSTELRDGAVYSRARMIALTNPLQQTDPRQSLSLSCVCAPSILGHCLC